MEDGSLAVDVRGLNPSFDDSCRSQRVEAMDEFWLTETTIGGGGFVEEFLTHYADDPRRYFRFLDAALSASDLETVGDELARVLEMVSSEAPEQATLTAAFGRVRSARSHDDSVRAIAILRSELARRGILPTATLMVAVNTRLLGPGTSPDTDSFVAALVSHREAAETRLDVDIDSRVFALVKSSDHALEHALGVTAVGDSDAARAAWRFGVLYGMLWPRGAQIRTESLRAWNPYDRLAECDRLLILVAVPRTARQVFLSADEWFGQLTEALLEQGAAELVAPITDSERLAAALLRIAAEPVDSEALLVHARLTGVHRDLDNIKASLELPEAIQ